MGVFEGRGHIRAVGWIVAEGLDAASDTVGIGLDDHHIVPGLTQQPCSSQTGDSSAHNYYFLASRGARQTIFDQDLQIGKLEVLVVGTNKHQHTSNLHAALPARLVEWA